MTRSASQYFSQIVKSKGNNIKNLMQTIERLRGMFFAVSPYCVFAGFFLYFDASSALKIGQPSAPVVWHEVLGMVLREPLLVDLMAGSSAVGC
jgi:hypothetical protein